MKLSFVFVIFAMAMASVSAQTCTSSTITSFPTPISDMSWKCENAGYGFGWKMDQCQNVAGASFTGSPFVVVDTNPKCPNNVVAGSVTVSCSNGGKSATITSTVAVVVYVKGGNAGGTLYSLAANTMSAPLGVGTNQDISHIEFCFPCCTVATPSPTAKTPSPTAKTPSPTAKTPSPTAKTPSPTAKTPSPTAKVAPPSGGNGDPHIKNWAGDWFDYMGEW
jgi:hypothetical protein